MDRRGLSALSQEEKKVAQEIHGMVSDLHSFLLPYLPLFGIRSESRETGEQFIHGLVSDLPRKSAEPISELFGKERKTFQRFVGCNPWPDELVRRKMDDDIRHTLGHPKGVISLDPSSCQKKGKDSVGVGRQWCGRLGKMENCQTGVYLNYRSLKGHSLVDTSLYLPKDWIRDKERRAKCHVPPEIKYQSHLELADDLLRKYASKLPHQRILADSEFGRDGEWRDSLSSRKEKYLVDIPNNLEIRIVYGDSAIPAPKKVGEWVKAQPEKAWKKFSIGTKSQGLVIMEAIMQKVVTLRKDNSLRNEILLATRYESDRTDVKFQLASWEFRPRLPKLVKFVTYRHSIEEDFQNAKSEVGMGDYEIRSWVGWHHHMTLSMLALWFLNKEKLLRTKTFFPSDSPLGKINHRNSDLFHPAPGHSRADCCQKNHPVQTGKEIS